MAPTVHPLFVRTCSSCAHPNPRAHAFCGACGDSLAAHACESCNYSNDRDQRFCGGCGCYIGAIDRARAPRSTRRTPPPPPGSVTPLHPVDASELIIAEKRAA